MITKEQEEAIRHLNKIRDYLTNEYNDANDFVRKRLEILLRQEVILIHKCSNCGFRFNTDDEECLKSGIVMWPDLKDFEI